MRPTVAIVGANLAGGRAAEALRSAGYDGRILLIGEEPHRPYERPPLSKDVVRGEAPPEKTFLRDESYYSDNDIELLLGARVTSLDPGEKELTLAEGLSISYDDVLLCTGVRVKRLPVPGMNLPGVYTLRTIEDSIAIKTALQPGAKVVVVGAGFIGAELAASASMLGCDVTIVELFETPMERALGPKLGAILGDIHHDEGVRFIGGVRTEGFEGHDRVERVIIPDDAIEADVVVVGVGVEPAEELARAAGLACDDGIIVDDRCRAAPYVYAAGDVARQPNAILGETIRVEHWQNAQNQAVAAANVIAGGDEPFAEVPWFWSDQYEHTIQLFGLPRHDDELVFRGDVEARSFAAFFLRDGRMTGAFSLGRGKDARAGRDLIKAGTSVDPAVLADDGTDLRALVRASQL